MTTQIQESKVETALIYCRKSTDRIGMQENSLDFQKRVCYDLLKSHQFKLVKDRYIEESESAKETGTRAGFERMLLICQNGWVDHIIVDEAKRLSRNTMDSAYITTLLEKKFIKSIITTGRRYKGDDSTDILLLDLDFWLSKKDNKDRSNDVKRKMVQWALNGKIMGKAPFGYRNITIGSSKDVEIVPDEAEIVRTVFIMRARWDTLEQVASYCNEQIVLKKKNLVWGPERIREMVQNTKYYGVQKYGGIEEKITTSLFQPILSQNLYDKANGITRGIVYDKSGKNDDRFHFQWLIRDPAGVLITPYVSKKKYVYYHAQTIRTGYKINILQDELFQKMGILLKDYHFPVSVARVSREILKEFYQDKIQREESSRVKIRQELEDIRKLKSRLTDKFIDDLIEKHIYEEKLAEYRLKEENLKEMDASLDQGMENVGTYIENLCGLMGNLSETYNLWDDTKKAQIIRSMQCGLFIDTKKELTIKENKLFGFIKSINFSSGAPDKNRTCD
jgi:DNA invertase Pin-like site-specific DNA recombinase